MRSVVSHRRRTLPERRRSPPDGRTRPAGRTCPRRGCSSISWAPSARSRASSAATSSTSKATWCMPGPRFARNLPTGVSGPSGREQLDPAVADAQRRRLDALVLDASRGARASRAEERARRRATAASRSSTAIPTWWTPSATRGRYVRHSRRASRRRARSATRPSPTRSRRGAPRGACRASRARAPTPVFRASVRADHPVQARASPKAKGSSAPRRLGRIALAPGAPGRTMKPSSPQSVLARSPSGAPRSPTTVTALAQRDGAARAIRPRPASARAGDLAREHLRAPPASVRGVVVEPARDAPRRPCIA